MADMSVSTVSCETQQILVAMPTEYKWHAAVYHAFICPVCQCLFTWASYSLLITNHLSVRQPFVTARENTAAVRVWFPSMGWCSSNIAGPAKCLSLDDGIDNLL